MEGSFELLPHQVPDPPRCPCWVDALRWAVMVADPGSADLKWSALFLGRLLSGRPLTPRQDEVAHEIYYRLCCRHADGDFTCQTTSPRPMHNTHRPALRIVGGMEASA